MAWTHVHLPNLHTHLQQPDVARRQSWEPEKHLGGLGVKSGMCRGPENVCLSLKPLLLDPQDGTPTEGGPVPAGARSTCLQRSDAARPL